MDRDHYVQTICDFDETVLAFSVATRNKRFRPVFEFGYEVRPLGEEGAALLATGPRVWARSIRRALPRRWDSVATSNRRMVR